MREYKATSYNLGFISDSHNECDKIDQVVNKHPEIEQWFFLGDLVSFLMPGLARNRKTQDWFFNNQSKCIWIKGNHDHVVARELLNIDHAFAWNLAQFEKSVKIILPNGLELLLYHSKPNDFWEFVDKNYTEWEFRDDYNFEDYTQAIVIGHNHSQFKKTFVDTDTEIWSIGALQQNCYGILTEKGFEFKKL